MNGPDDFNFVVDRAYAPGRDRKLRFAKEWIAYVDDLTVRSERVIDGQFYTDSEADQAIRDACSKGSVATPQSAGAALEAGRRQQGATDKRSKHDSYEGLCSGLGCLGLVGSAVIPCSYRLYTSACARVSDKPAEA